MRSALPYFWYPAFFALAIAAVVGLLAAGAALLVALYLPVALVAIAVVNLSS